ncbi:mushroom body large-type Kenyon cell-specific protein 1-like [Ornithodoros turicata]
MAECSLARCSQERRVFRKEFQRWSRDVLFVVGLERVAEELVGPKKWKKLTELESAIEQELEVTDWEPDEVCYFCNSKKMLPYDPASGFLPEGYSSFKSFRMDIDEQSTGSDHGNGSVSSNACQGADAYVEPTSPSASNDQPLDLSLHSHKHHPPEIDEILDGVDPLLKVPNLPCKIGKRRGDPLNCKRSYTEEELQAALRDIQSGKLGTRRAAVIYGIPRSTLRNKVYKLALERRAGRKVATVSSPSKDSVAFSNGIVDGSCNSKAGTPSASESLRQLLKSTITQKNQGKLVDKDPTTTELGGASSNSDAMSTFQLLSSLEYNKSLAPLFAQFLSSIQQLALNPNKDSCVLPNNTPPPDVKLPVMSDLIKLLAGERLEQECSRQREQQASPVTQAAESSNNVILKIPSYKPASGNCSALGAATTPANSSDAGRSGVTLSLKELIARSINQRVGSGANSTTTAATTTTSSNSSSNSSEKTPPQANGNAASSSPQQTTTPAKPDQQSEKRTRPKRGRYRNYDRDNLLQAVRAVQRGEMSVHRAGTYFGVPHSTLEYKVKERHLLRPKKRGTAAASAAKGYHHFKLDGLPADESAKVAALQNGAKTADGTCPPWQALPFLSMDLSKLGGGFFASQVMRKLQTTTCEAEKKAAESGGGAGILEALIKSTLERSTPSDGAKAGEPPALVKN